MSKSIFALKENDCRYILPNKRYCAEPQAQGNTSYCEHHHSLCYIRGSGRGGKSPVFLPVDKIDTPPRVEHKIPDVVEAMR